MKSTSLRNLLILTQNHRPLGFLPFESIFNSKHRIFSRPGALENFRLRQVGISDIAAIQTVYAGPGDYRLTDAKSRDQRISHLPFKRHKRGSSIVLTTGTRDPQDPQAVDRASIWSRVSSVLSLSPHFASAVQHRADMWPNQDLLGVHFRNSDNASNLEEQLIRVDAYLNQNGTNSKIRSIFWSTDDQASIDVVRKEFKNLQVFSHQPLDVAGKRNLHESIFAEEGFGHLSSTFQDLYSLASARHFLPTTGRSEWTHFVKWLRSNPTAAHGFFGTSLNRPL